MDWHWTARNIDPEKMPNGVILCRGWSGQPQGLIDNTFDGVAFIGYHSEWGSPYNPLSHTKNSDKIDFVKLDGEIVGEFETDSRLTKCYGIPTILLSGDDGLVSKYNKANFITIATTKSIGDSTIMIKTIDECKQALKDGMKKAVQKTKERNQFDNPEGFGGKVELQIRFRQHQDALKASFYPNAKPIDSQTVKIDCADYYEVQRAFLFLV